MLTLIHANQFVRLIFKSEMGGHLLSKLMSARCLANTFSHNSMTADVAKSSSDQRNHKQNSTKHTLSSSQRPNPRTHIDGTEVNESEHVNSMGHTEIRLKEIAMATSADPLGQKAFCARTQLYIQMYTQQS